MATSLIVTATEGGTGTDDGIILTVKVLTGAAAVQDGTTGSSPSLTVPQQAITPSATGSWIYGAVTNVAAATAFTPNSSTQNPFSQNVLYAGDGDTFGTFRSTATTTASTPVTVGASAPTEATTNLIWAAAEILASGTLAEDPSSPAPKNTTTATTISTASFSPPAGSLLVAMVSNNGTGSGTLTMTVSGGGLTWTQLAGETLNAASVWIAQVPPVFHGASQPARARLTREQQAPPGLVYSRQASSWSSGRISASYGAPLQNPGPGPVFRQATSPARARTPLPPRGRTASGPGAPLANPVPGPVFTQAPRPARIRPALPPRGRTGSNRGAPVVNPAKGPAFRQAVSAIRTRVPQDAPRGRTGSNRGGPVVAPPPPPPPPVPAVYPGKFWATPGIMRPGRGQPGNPYSLVRYRFTGRVPLLYLDYLDGQTRGTLYAQPGGTYVIVVANTRAGLTVPPDDGRWGGETPQQDLVPLHRRVFLKLREHIHRSRRRSGYRNPPGDRA